MGISQFLCRVDMSLFVLPLTRKVLFMNLLCRRAKLGPIQGGLQRASQDSTKGVVATFFTFYALKISLFRVFTLSD